MAKEIAREGEFSIRPADLPPLPEGLISSGHDIEWVQRKWAELTAPSNEVAESHAAWVNLCAQPLTSSAQQPSINGGLLDSIDGIGESIPRDRFGDPKRNIQSSEERIQEEKEANKARIIAKTGRTVQEKKSDTKRLGNNLVRFLGKILLSDDASTKLGQVSKDPREVLMNTYGPLRVRRLLDASDNPDPGTFMLSAFIAALRENSRPVSSRNVNYDVVTTDIVSRLKDKGYDNDTLVKAVADHFGIFVVNHGSLKISKAASIKEEDEVAS